MQNHKKSSTNFLSLFTFASQKKSKCQGISQNVKHQQSFVLFHGAPLLNHNDFIQRNNRLVLHSPSTLKPKHFILIDIFQGNLAEKSDHLAGKLAVWKFQPIPDKAFRADKATVLGDQRAGDKLPACFLWSLCSVSRWGVWDGGLEHKIMVCHD